MDQLKILLEHKFWVLSALAVLLPPIGWWVSTGDMATKADKRAKDIDGTIKSLSTVTNNKTTAANDDWIQNVKQVNVKLAAQVDRTHKALYDHQTPVMVWHPLVRQALDEAQVKYRGDTALNPHAFLQARRLFYSRYDDVWQSDVYKVLEPFEILKNTGKVLCTDTNGSIPITKAPFELWALRQNVSAEEMWNAQEDLWMLHALMQAVARVNEGSVNIDDARIKRLISATLRGGNAADLEDRRKKKQSAQTPGAGAGGPPGGMSRSIGFSPTFGNDRAPVETLPRALAMIDPDDIFGSDDSSGVAGGAGTKKERPSTVDSSSSENRYVITDSGGKWRARGFVLRVVMDHQEIPKLLTVLSESPFPVLISQVEHQSYVHQRNRTQTAAATSENDVEQKMIKASEERLNMALNQVNLADVLVAGTFTFYNEPAAPAPGSSASPAASPTKAAPQAAAGAKGTTVPTTTGRTTTAPTTNAKPGQPGASAPAAGGAPKTPAVGSPAKGPSPSGSAPPSTNTKSPTLQRGAAPPTSKPAQPPKT
jgi:hypothetical protein